MQAGGDLGPVPWDENSSYEVIEALHPHLAFQKVFLSKHENHDKSGLHEARAKSRIDRLVSLVSKHFSTSNTEVKSNIKIGKDVGASTTPVVLGKQDHMTSVIPVDVVAPVELLKLSMVANQARKGLSPFKLPTGLREARWTNNLPQTTMKRKVTAEAQSKKGNAQRLKETT